MNLDFGELPGWDPIGEENIQVGETETTSLG